jgi:hypothetical protein
MYPILNIKQHPSRQLQWTEETLFQRITVLCVTTAALSDVPPKEDIEISLTRISPQDYLKGWQAPCFLLQ